MTEQPMTLTMQSETNVTTCDRCKSSLERGWCERWGGTTKKGMRRAESICFDCDRQERHEAYAETNVLTTKIAMDSAIYEVRREDNRTAPDLLLDRAVRELADVRADYKAFERIVWFGGLQAMVRAASFRGFRADFTMLDGTEARALVWSCAGRTVITIETADEAAQVSVITADDSNEPVMGLQGILATKAQALALLDAACVRLAGGNGFKRDDKVGMF